MRSLSLLVGIALAALSTQAPAETRLTWHGHAAFAIVTPKGKVFMIDPWLNNPSNPTAANDQDPLAKIERVDYILVTHGHFDHVGDAVALGRKTGARLVTNIELGNNMAHVLGYPEKQMGFDTLFNIGGEIQLADGEVTVAMTPAVHSSGLRHPNPGEGGPAVVNGGLAAGFVLRIQNGPTIYHTGDTAYFSDMSLIGEQYAPDVALINIGGHFGMEAPMAARAAEAVKARIAIPQHFATFPVLTPDTKGFMDALKKRRIQGVEMQPGETLSFKGNKLQQQAKGQSQQRKPAQAR